MARTARNAGRKAARLGLLIGIAACAVIEDPPGGPPDFTAPVIVGVTPDSGAVVPDLDRAVRFEFDEVVSEQSGGGIARLIEFSPRTDKLDVSWKRKAIEVEPDDGWRPGIVYHVALLPGMADLRNNRMEEGRRIVFTTGEEIPNTRLDGVVLDWENGRIGQRALIEAVLLPDSLVYVGQADSIGEFTLSQLPRGEYVVYTSIDGNTNRRREGREPFDSIRVQLDSTASHVFWAFVQDTVGPRIREITPIDSTAIRIEFSQRVPPGPPDPGAFSVWALPDTVGVGIAAVFEAATFDSVQAEERAAAAAAAADSAAAADAFAVEEAAADTALAVAVRPEDQPADVPGQDSTAVPADTARALKLLAERPVLSSSLVIRFSNPLAAGDYLVDAVLTNLAGAVGDSRRAFRITAPPDST
ncbi:MAG: Ig-like domain-containing protein [Gemmatimonadota bacterium]|jgi:hypothetical protein